MKLFLSLLLIFSATSCAVNSSAGQSKQAKSETSTQPTMTNASTRVTSDAARRRSFAREQVVDRISAAWAKSGTTEPLGLIVLDADERGRVYEVQLSKIFPKGRSHLPETLTPRVIYCVDPECSRAVQHLGRASQDGFNFVLMRFIPPAK